MDIAALKSKIQTMPFTKSLRVKITDVGEWTDYESNSRKSRSSYLKFVASDTTDTVKGVAYDRESQCHLIAKGASLLLRNYLFNNSQLKLTSSTKIYKCQTIDAIDVSGTGLSSPKKTIAEIKNSPVKEQVCLEGTIVKEEAAKPVKVGTRDAKVRELTLTDSTGEMKVSLWDGKINCPVKCGDSVRITDGIVKYSTFYGENTISVNALTDVKQIEIATTAQKTKILAVRAIDDSVLDIIVENEQGSEQELSCSKETFAKYLDIDVPIQNKDLEDTYITPLLPIQCTVSVKGKDIVNIQ